MARLLMFKKIQCETDRRMTRQRPYQMDTLYKGVVLLTLLYFTYEFYYSLKRLQVLQWNSRKSEMSYESLVGRMNLTKNQSLGDDMTVVTAFFEIDNLDKSASLFSQRDLDTYKQWMGFFQYLNNSVIFFTDSAWFAKALRDMRKGVGQTRIFEIDRQSLYSFRLAKKIKDIFSQPGYPDHSPNTVNENYSCIMHSKFELMQKVISEKMYTTKYIAWLDFGFFRHQTNDKRIFTLHVPTNFDDNKVSFTQYDLNRRSETPATIIRGNKVWVTGGIFIARPEVMLVFSEDYIKAVETLLDMNWMSTDQQVIYSMYSVRFPLKPRVEIQTYSANDGNWFFLGDISREIWAIERRKNVSLVHFFSLTM